MYIIAWAGILFARPMPGQMLLQKEQKVLRNYHIREQAAVKEKPAPVPALDRWFPPAKMLAVSDKAGMASGLKIQLWVESQSAILFQRRLS